MIYYRLVLLFLRVAAQKSTKTTLQPTFFISAMPKLFLIELLRLISATKYSVAGLIAAFKHQAAFKHEIFWAFFLIPFAVYLGRTPVEQILLILPVVIVLIAELINSAIETIVDRIGTDFNELSGRAKDIGSAAVFVALLLVPLIWGLVLFDYFIN